ncbi:MAG: hypothetical protein ACRDI1_06230 [Actinomycetota bacterium]
MIRRILSVVISTTLFFALSLGVALAKQAGDHDGDADRRTDTRYTEDNDTNDGGTGEGVADSEDNQHPSGQDRSIESGKSGTQGKAESDPDNDGKGPDRSNGGIDKANGPGGDDLADQDGNNGCGNDDDFEDDNEGWCGKPKVESNEEEAEVLGDQRVRPAGSQVAGASEELPTDVLGASFSSAPTEVLGANSEAGQALPTTGLSFGRLLLVASAMLGFGLLAETLYRRRRTSSR